MLGLIGTPNFFLWNILSLKNNEKLFLDMDSPNQVFILYLQQLKDQAVERGNPTGAKIYKKCIAR